MGFLDRLTSKETPPPEEDWPELSPGPQPGDVYEGPHAYCADYALVERPGFYALTEDGKVLLEPLLRLVMIDDFPGDAEQLGCHLEVAGPHDPPQMSVHSRQPIESQGEVSFSAAVEGSAEVGL